MPEINVQVAGSRRGKGKNNKDIGAGKIEHILKISGGFEQTKEHTVEERHAEKLYMSHLIFYLSLS